MTPSRNDNETTSVRPAAACPVCGTAFSPVRRQRFCSSACRQAAWRTRHTATVLEERRPETPRRGRRQISVYACPDCEQRYLGVQWCEDCVRPCTLLGVGGLSPCCDEPITIDELLAQHEDRRGGPSKIR